MGINEIKKNGFKILLATILCVIAFSATSRANSRDVSFREIFSKSQSEPGEAFYFFIPQKAEDKNQYTYVYDTKLDRLLLFPENKSLISKIEGQEINPKDWPGLLNEFILSEDSPPLKVIELDENWVKFTLNGRHIVLPRKFMVEGWGEKNFPLGQEIVDKDTSLPEEYVPDDLVKINQKWNFHTPDYPKYLRRYVARMIERILQNAEEQGVHIRVFSAYRSYEKQRYLYLNAISRYGESQNKVAKPGHSEHQLGTTVDLCGLDPKTVLNPDFDRTKEGRWLMENAPKLGFFQSYTKENQHQTGYVPEPWHYRFYGEKRLFSVGKRLVIRISGYTAKIKEKVNMGIFFCPDTNIRCLKITHIL
jgi:LAS superfamily LD-carboxypeptidase LdcB